MILLAPLPAFAEWFPAPENGGVPVVQLSDYQGNPQSIPDGSGGTIIVWEDARALQYDIYVQRLAPDGTPMWTPNGVQVTSLGTAERFPRITTDGRGGAIIGWQDLRNGNDDIFVARVDASGALPWTPNGVPMCTYANTQDDVRLVPDLSGGAILVWSDQGAGNRDLYARRVNGSGTPLWIVDGNAISVQPNSQYNQRAVADGQGGAIITWQDERSGTGDIYAQRVDSLGTLHWTISGVAISTAAGVQEMPRIVSDDAGGAIISWSDLNVLSGEVLAQRLNGSGTAQWTAGGVNLSGSSANVQRFVASCTDGVGGAFVFWEDNLTDVTGTRITSAGTKLSPFTVCNATGVQSAIATISDGAGGAVVAWTDTRNSNFPDLYAQRVTSAGFLRWQTNGIPVSTAGGFQNAVALSTVEDGVVAAWQDARGSVNFDVYAQRLDRFGYLGDPGPVLLEVADVAGDQGGQVRLSWNASYLDLDPYFTVASYWVLRSAPTSAALRAVAQGARLVSDPAALPGPGRTFLAESDGIQTTYWEFVASAPAFSSPGYSVVAPTTTDSVAVSNPLTLFRLQARNYSGSQFWFSNPDSGYSVDDLAPVTPAPFTGTYLVSGNELEWGANPEPDVAEYRLYRGLTPDFTPSAGTFVTAVGGTTYTDAAGLPYSYYKLAAVDVHGNVSLYATLAPGGTTAVGDASPRSLAFSGASPNPLRGAGAFAFALPRATHARLELFGVDGRRIRRLVDGELPAGDHAVRWDGRDAEGSRVASGLYFARFTAEGRTFTHRFAIAR